MAKVTITLTDLGDDGSSVRFEAAFEPKLKKGEEATSAQLLGLLVTDYAQSVMDQLEAQPAEVSDKPRGDSN